MKKLKYYKIFLIGYFIIAFLLSAFMASKVIISKGLIAEFNQKVIILTPYISGYQLKKIKSDWALMKTIDDFNKINLELNSFATSLKIDFPKSVYF